MKRNTLIVISFSVILIIVSWVGAYLWVQSERAVFIDRLNRLDYSLVHSDSISDYLVEDVDLTLEDLTNKNPADTRLRSFPELYLAARALGYAGERESSVKYYSEAEKYLDDYHKREDVIADFYMSYISQATAIEGGKEELARIADRAAKAIDGLSSMSDQEKGHYKQTLNVYVTGEALYDEEE